MNFSEIIEKFFRDILSYIIPGSILLLFIMLSNFDDAIYISNRIKSLLGEGVYFWLLIIVSYVTGYSTSTFGFFLKDIIDICIKKSDLNDKKIESHIKVLEKNGLKYDDTRKLAQVCLYRMQNEFPGIYKEKIEKRIALRNFELNLVVTFLIILLLRFVLNVKFYYLIYGGILFFCIIFILGCFRLDREINYYLPIESLASLVGKSDEKS